MKINIKVLFKFVFIRQESHFSHINLKYTKIKMIQKM